MIKEIEMQLNTKVLISITFFIFNIQFAFSALSATIGWSEIPNTKLNTVCPDTMNGYDYKGNCEAVVTAWNSATLDDTRNRLIVWGGGHQDYSGNELYAVDLNTLTIKRLSDPAPPASGCPEDLAGGTQPNSRHTYNGLTFISHLDKLFVAGGSLANCGYMSNGTWTFDFKTLKWQAMKPKGDRINAAPGIISAYDPVTKKVYLHDDGSFFSYTYETNTYKLLSEGGIDYHLTGVLDPVHRKFIMIGGGQQWMIDLNDPTYKHQVLGSTGGSAVINADSPGLTYDAVENHIVAWSGGNTAHIYDVDKKIWSTNTNNSGPGAAMSNGTNGRFAFVPSLNVFVLVNGMAKNAYVLRLNPKAGVPIKTMPIKSKSKKEKNFLINSVFGIPENNLSLLKESRDLQGRKMDMSLFCSVCSREVFYSGIRATKK